MDILSFFDLYGVKFHFYTENHRSNYNPFGGVMSLLYVISCFFVIIIFSLRDIKRLNPITTRSEIYNTQYRKVEVRADKLWIPWRFVTYEEKYIDHKNVIFPEINYVNGIWIDEIGMKLNYTSLKYKLCNETSMVNKTDNYKIDVPLNQLYC